MLAGRQSRAATSHTSVLEVPRHSMDIDEVVRVFMERLDRGELNGHLGLELPKLSYEQLLRVARILAEREEKRQGQCP